MMYRKRFISVFIISLLFCQAEAQKVGLVLSGGGAGGLAHIGVIKALEEDSIPIDYITGTSIGALVGALYCVGYSPNQMEKIVTSDEFQTWAYGIIPDNYIYYFKKKDDNASWVIFKLALDSLIETSLPTNLVSPVPVDFALMEYTASANAKAKGNFDSLFIPFRCLASDIEEKKSVIFRGGDLGTAIRASMAYPFYLKPITVNGKLLFDGGIYNNFPADIMYDDFFPDIIIGSNVSGNEPAPNEESLISQLKTMLLTKTNFDVVCQNGVIIEPKVDNVSTFNFEKVQPLVDAGYTAAKTKISEIKKHVWRTVSPGELKQKRDKYLTGLMPIVFKDIYIEGLKKNQSKYVEQVLRKKSKQFNIARLKPEYYKLASDDKLKTIFPYATFNQTTGYYDLHVKVKKEKELVTQIGGNFSNRPISAGFIGAQYNYLGRIAGDISANAYFGKLFTSGQIKLKIDVPWKIPFYVESNFTVNKWDFFKSSAEFVTDVRPSFLVQYEQYLYGDLGFPFGRKGKLVAGTGLAWLTDEYYQTSQFLQKDTADLTDFNLYNAHVYYESNTLNKKQYASQGRSFLTKFQYIQGEEYYRPGSTSFDTLNFRKIHEWVQLKIVYDKYFKNKKAYKLGIYFEGVYSTQTLFNNYSSSILSAPAFQPLPESKTLFQEKYRAHKYAAFGVKNIFSIRKIIDIRIEGYVYQPYQRIIRGPQLKATYTDPFSERFFIAMAALVIHTPIGPTAVSINYYSQELQPYTFMFHFGYIIFNKKANE